MIELKDYDAFVRELNENHTRKKTAVEDAVNKGKIRGQRQRFHCRSK